jgi:hypothetical protein
MNEILNVWLRPDVVGHHSGQAVIHLYHGSQHFSDTRHLPCYHTGTTFFEGELFLSSPQGSIDSQGYVDEIWVPSRRHGSRSGSNGMSVNTNNQRRFLG